MTRASGRPVVLVLAAAFAAGCADRVAAPSLIAPDPAAVATLVVKGSAKAGSIATLSARLTQTAAAKRTGAYLAHIEYDTSLVTYVGQGDATGGIAAFHAQNGVLRVAGATLDGYGDGVLFNVQFRVTRASSQGSLRLVIDELRDVNLGDRLPRETSARSSLLRPWR